MKEKLLLMSLHKNVTKNRSFDAIAEDLMREERLFWESNILLNILLLKSEEKKTRHAKKLTNTRSIFL